MKPTDEVPCGIEVLVKKASVDPEFRKLLLEKRAGAALEIGLELEPAEATMINAVPKAQLEAIIATTAVEPRQRTAFLGRVAAVMIVALGASTVGCGREEEAPTGIRPDRPDVEEEQEAEDDEISPPGPTRGVQPDRPEAREKEEEKTRIRPRRRHRRSEETLDGSLGLRPERP